MLNGVPQGSCLGPLLFLLYVNDIPFGNSSTVTHLYVDDTTLHYSSPSVTELNINLQRGANASSLLANSNKMVIHQQKSKIMILGSQRKLEGTKEYLNVKISGKTVQQSHCEKVLGVYLNSSLKWSDHVFKCIKNFNSKLELIRRAKPYLSPSHMLLLYNSIAKPTIEYCCSVWGNCSSELLKHVLLAQKRAARLLLNTDASCRSLELFQKLKIFPFSDIVRQRTLNLTFKSLSEVIYSLIVWPTYLKGQVTVMPLELRQICQYLLFNTQCHCSLSALNH